MNKPKARHVTKAAGIPVAEHKPVDKPEVVNADGLEPPCAAKPRTEGSSFGAIIVPAEAAHSQRDPSRPDWRFGNIVMVEKCVPGRELTCGATGDRALAVIEVLPQSEAFQDYGAKYRPGDSKHVLPANLSPFIYQNIQTLALEAHRSLGCRGASRADCRFDDQGDGTGQIVCLEVNTQPRMKATSLLSEMAALAGVDFGELVSWMVEDASCRR